MQPGQRFTPPRQAELIAQSGALLPLWWAREGDYILAPGANAEWVSSVKRQFGLQGEIYAGQATDCCAPWGWSHDARSRFADAGVEVGSLPGDEWLLRHRSLSHRRISAAVMEGLRPHLHFNLPPAPIEARDEATLWEAIDKVDGRAMVKLPYSTSGRGIIDTTAPRGMAQLRNSAAGMLRRQGSVMVEQRLDKLADFATLFDIDTQGVARPMGYSLFYTSGATSYSGNRLMPDDDIRSELTRFVDKDDLLAVERALPPLLTNLIGTAHRGPLGVDMLIYRSDKACHINPCVEVNLRMTMGVLAHHLTRRFYDGTPRSLIVAPGPAENVLKNLIQPLVPPNQHFTFAIFDN